MLCFVLGTPSVPQHAFILPSAPFNNRFFKQGKQCSWHYHKLKDEVFFLHSGKMLVRLSDGDDIEKATESIITPGKALHIYRGLRHQMEALEDSELYEFSTQHFDSDSHRIEKGD